MTATYETIYNTEIIVCGDCSIELTTVVLEHLDTDDCETCATGKDGCHYCGDESTIDLNHKETWGNGFGVVMCGTDKLGHCICDSWS